MTKTTCARQFIQSLYEDLPLLPDDGIPTALDFERYGVGLCRPFTGQVTGIHFEVFSEEFGRFFFDAERLLVWMPVPNGTLGLAAGASEG